MNDDQVTSILSIAIIVSGDTDRWIVEQEIELLLAESPLLMSKLEQINGQLVLSGDDELQLESAAKKILEVVDITMGEPQIIFRETIRKASEAEGKYIRQTGGSGNYGHCWLRVEPNQPGKSYEFINEIKGGVVPKEYIKPIDQGVQGAMEQGVLAGVQVVDVKVALFDGSYHEVDSNENAFKIAGSLAFKEAARKASPVLLEPVMAVEVTVSEEFTGTIIDDINSRRGRIEGIEHLSGSQMIKAMVPLAELLRSSRHGRPKYSMRFARYEPVHRPGGLGENDSFVFATKPQGPKPKGQSTSAQPSED